MPCRWQNNRRIEGHRHAVQGNSSVRVLSQFGCLFQAAEMPSATVRYRLRDTRRFEVLSSLSGHQGIMAGLVGVVPFFKFLLGHIRRVKLGAGWFFTIALDERLVAVQSFPGTVIDLGEFPDVCVLDDVSGSVSFSAMVCSSRCRLSKVRRLYQEWDHLLFIF